MPTARKIEAREGKTPVFKFKTFGGACSERVEKIKTREQISEFADYAVWKVASTSARGQILRRQVSVGVGLSTRRQPIIESTTSLAVEPIFSTCLKRIDTEKK